MKKVLFSLSLMLFAVPKSHALFAQGVGIIPTAETLASSAPSASNVAAVVTVSSPTGGGAYSTGYFNYIADIHVVAYATATISGTATPITCTFTGLPVNPTITLATAQAIGTLQVRDYSLNNPIQANQGSQVVLTCPATVGIIWNLKVGYFVGP